MTVTLKRNVWVNDYHAVLHIPEDVSWISSGYYYLECKYKSDFSRLVSRCLFHLMLLDTVYQSINFLFNSEYFYLLW
jgi:hypothetical protein